MGNLQVYQNNYEEPGKRFDAHDLAVRSLYLLKSPDEYSQDILDERQVSIDKIIADEKLNADEFHTINQSPYIDIYTGGSNGNIWFIHRVLNNQWCILDEVGAPEYPMVLTWSDLVDWIYKLKRIEIVVLTKMGHYGSKVKNRALYRCVSESGDPDCWEEKEEKAEKIQAVARGIKGRRRTKAMRVAEDVSLAPPQGSFPGGDEYRKAKKRNKKLFKKDEGDEEESKEDEEGEEEENGEDEDGEENDKEKD